MSTKRQLQAKQQQSSGGSPLRSLILGYLGMPDVNPYFGMEQSDIPFDQPVMGDQPYKPTSKFRAALGNPANDINMQYKLGQMADDKSFANQMALRQYDEGAAQRAAQAQAGYREDEQLRGVHLANEVQKQRDLEMYGAVPSGDTLANVMAKVDADKEFRLRNNLPGDANPNSFMDKATVRLSAKFGAETAKDDLATNLSRQDLATAKTPEAILARNQNMIDSYNAQGIANRLSTKRLTDPTIAAPGSALIGLDPSQGIDYLDPGTKPTDSSYDPVTKTFVRGTSGTPAQIRPMRLSAEQKSMIEQLAAEEEARQAAASTNAAPRRLKPKAY